MSSGICFSRSSSAFATRVELRHAFRLQLRAAGVEEHFRLEDEAVADDAHVRPVAEDLPQPAEEIRAIARKFLHALRQRDVEPLAKLGEAGLRFFLAFVGDVERRFQRAELAAQRCDLLIECLDLRQRAGGE